MQIFQDIVLNYVIMPIIASLATAFLGWAALQWQKWTGQQIEAKQREALQSALVNGINFALQNLLARQPGVDVTRLNPAQRSGVMQDAQSYVRMSVPGALDHFKLTTDAERLKALLQPKLPLPIPQPAALAA